MAKLRRQYLFFLNYFFLSFFCQIFLSCFVVFWIPGSQHFAGLCTTLGRFVYFAILYTCTNIFKTNYVSKHKLLDVMNTKILNTYVTKYLIFKTIIVWQYRHRDRHIHGLYRVKATWEPGISPEGFTVLNRVCSAVICCDLQSG